MSCTQLPPGTEVPSLAPLGTPVSGLPEPGEGGLPAPQGKTCNLRVLDWAGFSGAASFTFDDGQPSQVDHWPELRATGVPLTFYLTAEGSTPAADAVWREALAAGCELGNHSGTHRGLKEVGDRGAIALDIGRTEEYLRKDLGQPGAPSFAYPFGDTGWKAGFQGRFLLARSVFPGSIRPLDQTDPLALPIYGVKEGDTEATYLPLLQSAATGNHWTILMFHSLLPGANWFAGVEVEGVLDSLRWAKHDGRLWLGTVQRIGAYWLAQKQFAALQPETKGRGLKWTWPLPAPFPQGQYLRVTVDGGTLTQGGDPLPWNDHGFYEVALDAGRLEWTP